MCAGHEVTELLNLCRSVRGRVELGMISCS